MPTMSLSKDALIPRIYSPSIHTYTYPPLHVSTVCIQHPCRIWKLFSEATGIRDLTTGYGHFDVHNLLRAGIYEHTLPTMSLSEEALTPRIEAASLRVIGSSNPCRGGKNFKALSSYASILGDI